MAIDFSELRDLDFNNLGSASTGVKAIVLGFLVVLRGSGEQRVGGHDVGPWCW